MRNSQNPVGSVADALANDGRGMRGFDGHRTDGPPLLRLTAREAYQPHLYERHLIDRISHAYELADSAFPRWLITTYYVSLKTNPLVILAGAEGTGKADFSRLFATALFGAESSQFALIPGQVAWHGATGEGSYYRSIHERFTSLRFIELLHEAAAPANLGKLYFVCFQRLHPAEFEAAMTSLLHVGPDGQWRLNIPGVPSEQQQIIPANVRISATVDTNDEPWSLQSSTLHHAGVIDMVTPMTRQADQRDQPPPPPGLQRLWLRSIVCDVHMAYRRLAALLGSDALQQLTISAPLRDALRRADLPLIQGPFTLASSAMQPDLVLAVANSFDHDGQGLFDARHPLHNAQIALDTQLIQRMRGRVREGYLPTIAEYFGDEALLRRVA